MCRYRPAFYFAILMLIVTFLLADTPISNAENDVNDNYSRVSVYASNAEQEYFNSDFCDHYGLTETIGINWNTLTPVYYYDLRNYVIDKEIVLDTCDSRGFYAYNASFDEFRTDGEEHKGIFHFNVKNGHIWSSSYTETIVDELGADIFGYGFFRSDNYADYAEEIKQVLGRTDIIDPKSVRFVVVNGLGADGSCFYIDDEIDNCFITIYGSYSTDTPLEERKVKIGVVHVGDELLKAKESFVEYMQAAQNNGESGGGEFTYTPETQSDGKYLQNITDIEGYFGANYSLGTHFPDAIRKTNFVPFIAVAGGTLIAGGAAVAIVMINSRKKLKYSVDNNIAG